ncbi:unnamed protein product [Cuscuta epithymum]|nr:unnamed protein product [Cuscuta epithymum]
MLLTTVDYAVDIATSLPCGPVHINCPFREPLDSSPKPWERSCLSGLNVWMSTAKPFTRYFKVQHPFDCSYADNDMAEVLQVIQMAKKGLLLFGSIHGEDDVWAALLLAKHLSWPVVVDILSGLRLRKYIDHIPEIDNEVLFIDHLDHLLLSDSVKEFMQADVIIQIGSRITSKRISEMLESCFPCSYIMVDKHPSRHDPMHIVTHRVQNIIHFTNYLLKAFVPRSANQWRHFLQTLSTTAGWEISLQITSEISLTEPYVANTILDVICCGSAIFFGNSMPIRDADMYARNTPQSHHNLAIKLGSGSCHYIQVGSNRGASGIDGVLSTAIGFAVGCNKRVISVLGDVSFLHDTNGLSLLREQIPRKPMTILVINNHGGAIFSFLPVAAKTERNILDQYFYTCHDVSVQNLCLAHGVKHVKVSTKMDLRDALLTSKSQHVDCVIEVNSSIEDNAHFHSTLRKFTWQAMNHAMDSLSRISIPDSIFNGSVLYEVGKMEYSLYRVQLCSPPTSASANNKSSAFFREGFIISLSLTDGSIGFGEVAPLEIHKENLFDVEEQLLFLTHAIGGVTIKQFLPLLKGLFSSWLWRSLGIPTGSIFPSVRCGLEMAVLNAIGASEGSSLLNILCPQTVEFPGRSLLDVKICALLDSNAPPEEIASIAADLVNEGFAALKLKVARHHDPNYDALVIQEIRKKVGEEVEIRADANRNWSYEEAIQFAHSVKNCCLQYIEEPVKNEDDIIRFYEATGLPVALDETINTDRENQFELLSKYTHPGIVAFVIKPSVIGGFENAALVARWAQLLGKSAVISATYETSLGLSAYVQFSYFIDLQNLDILRIANKEVRPSIAHGLGTYKWFKEDASTQNLVTRRNSTNGFMGSPIADADRLLKEFQFNKNALVRDFAHVEVQTYQQKIYLDSVSISINVHEIGPSENDIVLVFLHGFLGTGEDWIPIMKAISGSARCISIDLPGHGASHFVDWVGENAMAESTFSIEAIVTILCDLFDYLHLKKVILVGYSMGARIALYMSLRCSAMIEGAVIVSGSPGLKDLAEREMRRAKDDFTASFLVSSGLESFLDIWYAGDLWNSLRCHPHFKKIVSNRLRHANLETLARVLSDLSIGRQPSLWDDLKRCELPLVFIVGERDAKFKAIAQKMHDTITDQNGSGEHWSEIVEIPYCGHAAHLENPLPVISAISRFLRKLKN